MVAHSILVIALISSGCRAEDTNYAVLDSANTISIISTQYVSTIGNRIGRIAEARYVDAGRKVVVLDRTSPHLLLFSADGQPLWIASSSDIRRAEFGNPQVLGVHGDEIIVLQHEGPASIWHVAGDSLLLQRTVTMPVDYHSIGLVPGCQHEWFLYARNDRQFIARNMGTEPETIDYLHALSLSRDVAEINPLWADSRNLSATLGYGHTAVRAARHDHNVVIWHRSSEGAAGHIIEFNCDGESHRVHSENAMVTGDGIPAAVPRPRALEWTGGVIAYANGFSVAVHRYFVRGMHGDAESHWKTEIFSFIDGDFKGSTVVEGQWMLMDYDSGSGVLISSTKPLPHFVRVPLDILSIEESPVPE